MTEPQRKALEMLQRSPRITSRRTHHGYVSGSVASTLIAKGWAKRERSLGEHQRAVAITSKGILALMDERTRRSSMKKRDTIRGLAAEIKARWPQLDVHVETSMASTDRQIAGTRLRSPGKGRKGTRIVVRDRKGEVVLDHNNAETYRRTADVRDWMDCYAPHRRTWP